MKRLAMMLGVLAIAAATASAGDSGGLGLGAGVVKVNGASGANTWLTANLRTMLSGHLALEPEGGIFWASNLDETVYNFGGSLLVVIPASRADVFAGGGLGAHLYRYSQGGTNATHLGYHFLGGVDLLATNTISFFGAARYEIVSQAAPRADIKQWKFYGGIRFRAH